MSHNAIETFREFESGLMNLIRAADLFVVLHLFRHRQEPVPPDLVNIILEGNRLSGFTFSSDAYKPGELEMLAKNAHFRQLGEQILLASYTALEIYLIQKFREYYSHLRAQLPAEIRVKEPDDFKPRGIAEIRDIFKDVLDIHLAAFDFQYFTDDKSQFQQEPAWVAIMVLAKSRNEIAHRGRSSSYVINSPIDSWYPFEFVRGWVSHFDANFDPYIYEGRQTSLIAEYKSRCNN